MSYLTQTGLKLLGVDLDSYIESNYSGVPVMDTEFDKRDLDSLKDDNTIPGIRIGWWEAGQQGNMYASQNELIQYRPQYTMQLFMRVAKAKEYDVNIEYELMDLKDVIFDWVQQVNVTFVSCYYLLYLNWNGVQFVDRQPNYSVLELKLEGLYNRDTFVGSGIGAWIIEKDFIVQ